MAFLLAVAFLLAGCGNGSKNVELPDVTKPETVTLIQNTRQGPIHSLTVTGLGKIDGDAVIVLMLNGEPYKTEHHHNRYMDIDEALRKYDIATMRNGMNRMPDGEEVFFISTPSAGLWSTKERME